MFTETDNDQQRIVWKIKRLVVPYILSPQIFFEIFTHYIIYSQLPKLSFLLKSSKMCLKILIHLLLIKTACYSIDMLYFENAISYFSDYQCCLVYLI